MRLPAKFGFRSVYREITELVTDVGAHLGTIVRILNGQVGYGDQVSPDNMKGVWTTATFSATPGTELAITHNLGQIPVGVHIMVPPVTGVINRTGTAWTTTQIFLSCTGASQTAELFILAPSQGS